MNVTAGADLGMNEFQAVGEAINNFASDEALVVMGTVLEESGSDELRVTVVATGLDQASVREASPGIKLVKPSSDGQIDYKRLDRPTVIRNQAAEQQVPGLETDS